MACTAATIHVLPNELLQEVSLRMSLETLWQFHLVNRTIHQATREDFQRRREAEVSSLVCSVRDLLESMFRGDDFTRRQDLLSRKIEGFVKIVLRPVPLLTKIRLRKVSNFYLLVTGPPFADWRAAARELAKLKFLPSSPEMPGLKVDTVRVELAKRNYEVKCVDGRIQRRSAPLLGRK